MLDAVRRYMRKEMLAVPGEALWVAVSGGIDSMALLHGLRALGHPCQVAHVDHGLRGAGSDADRDFVETWCREQAIPFRAQRVDVAARAGATGVSTQMAARELRYAWFRELVEEGAGKLALAHHRDDAVETLMLHVMRGMGARGWAAIPPRSGPFIRPLMGVGREDVAAYVSEHGIPFREDPGNRDPKYLRNRVRHELLPRMDELRPGTLKTLSRSVDLLREMEGVAGRAVDQALEGLAPLADGTLPVPFERVTASGAPLLTLHRLLRGRGFHPDRIGDLLAAIMEGSVGARFQEGDTVVLVDRDELRISTVAPSMAWTIAAPDAVPEDAPLSISPCVPRDTELGQGPGVAWMDAHALRFPLELRTWRAGDRIEPIGMTGSKLVSDVLIDAKVPRDRKDRTLVLVSEGRIAWLCGHRVARGFEARPESGMVLRVALRGGGR